MLRSACPALLDVTLRWRKPDSNHRYRVTRRGFESGHVASARLGELFLKARLGWREIDLGPKEKWRAERGGNSGELPEAERKRTEDAERRLDAKLARLVPNLKVGETGGSSAG